MDPGPRESLDDLLGDSPLLLRAQGVRADEGLERAYAFDEIGVRARC